MTCQQLGGPCPFKLSGASADEIIKAQDRHLNDAVNGGDDTHRPALLDMKGRWKKPLTAMRWYRNAKHEFAALPEDQADPKE